MDFPSRQALVLLAAVNVVLLPFALQRASWWQRAGEVAATAFLVAWAWRRSSTGKAPEDGGDLSLGGERFRLFQEMVRQFERVERSANRSRASSKRLRSWLDVEIYFLQLAAQLKRRTADVLEGAVEALSVGDLLVAAGFFLLSLPAILASFLLDPILILLQSRTAQLEEENELLDREDSEAREEYERLTRKYEEKWPDPDPPQTTGNGEQKTGNPS